MEEFDDYECYSAKVVLLGAAGVGKTCLAIRFITNKFADLASPTIGAAYMKKKIEMGGERLILQIWDTAGQERFESMTSMYFRGADAAVLVFDLTDERSLERVKHWAQVLLRHRDVSGVRMVIAANKADLVEAGSQLLAAATEYASEISSRIFETSTLSGSGVFDMFDYLANCLLRKRLEETGIHKTKTGIVLDEPIRSSKRKSDKSSICCSML